MICDAITNIANASGQVFTLVLSGDLCSAPAAQRSALQDAGSHLSPLNVQAVTGGQTIDTVIVYSAAMSSDRNNILTASRMNCLVRCQRQHYWQCEVGLVRSDKGLALRIGTAWALGQEARWRGADYDTALAAAIPLGVELAPYELAKVAALLAAYYDHYSDDARQVAVMHPEVKIAPRELGVGEFEVSGKIDGLGVMKDGRHVIVEGKSTSDPIDPDSDYWLRLAFNMQLCQYIVESRYIGWDVRLVVYDVLRKPTIRPLKRVYDRDDNDRKIVLDKEGNRVMMRNGKPRQSSDDEKGWFLQEHPETPDEYCDRLYKDALTRPAFYFVRREVPVIDGQLITFELQRIQLARQILRNRTDEAALIRHGHHPCNAWPRNVSKDTCNFCSYKSFCLTNITPDLGNPPEGFSVQPFNPELNERNDDECDSTSDQLNESAV